MSKGRLMRIYNTLSRQTEHIVPIRKGHIGIYSCGPTVYFYPHIGNFRTYVIQDLLKLALIQRGYAITHVMNITDVGHNIGDDDVGEDKVRSKAAIEHKSMKEISEFYTQIFYSNIADLALSAPTRITKASEHVEMMLELIKKLDDKGYLYKASNGIYFDTSKFKDYGMLTGMDFNELNLNLKAGARVERPEGLRNITDFAVWRFAKGNETEMIWDSKFGRGFPGWHIECSAMSMHYLGEHFDIHCGGIDHIPIHHTNEIAQSEGASGKKFVNYWFHTYFLIVDGKKMSKSKGNIYTIEDLKKMGHSIFAYKYLLLSSHYRSEINFTLQSLDSAESSLNRIYLAIDSLKEIDFDREDSAIVGRIFELQSQFDQAIDEDLNTPVAFALLHEAISIINTSIENKGIGINGAKAAFDMLRHADFVFRIGISERIDKKNTIPKEAEELIEKRNAARKVLDFKGADAARLELKEKYGIIIEDTKDGQKVRFK